MNKRGIIPALLCGCSLLGSGAHADMILTAAGTAGNHLFIGSPAGTLAARYNTVPAGAYANIYWDADRDGVFGEAGENSGNSSATLAFNTPAITSGTVFHFGVEGFATPDDTGLIEFSLLLTDSSIARHTAVEGTPITFFDSTGDEWQADFLFNFRGYGDVVRNIDSVPGGATQDHQGVLTFTQIPEPGTMTTVVLGFGFAALALRRRR